MTEWRPPEGWTVEPKRDRWDVTPPEGFGDPFTLMFEDYPTDCGLIAALRNEIEGRMGNDRVTAMGSLGPAPKLPPVAFEGRYEAVVCTCAGGPYPCQMHPEAPKPIDPAFGL